MRARLLASLLVGLFAMVAAGCGGGGGEEAGTQPTTTTAPAPGDATKGKQIFIAQGCGGCHALSAAGTRGTTGPDLGEALTGVDGVSIRESIVDPDRLISGGYEAGLMPDYKKLSDQELSDLVAFLLQSA